MRGKGTRPVWDAGPWNIHDDHWNPSSVREMFKSLPQGLPEAQAAYESGYNDGVDGFGRRSSTRPASTWPTARSTTSGRTTTAG